MLQFLHNQLHLVLYVIIHYQFKIIKSKFVITPQLHRLCSKVYLNNIKSEAIIIIILNHCIVLPFNNLQLFQINEINKK